MGFTGTKASVLQECLITVCLGEYTPHATKTEKQCNSMDNLLHSHIKHLQIFLS